ncbi:hypothetical protein L1987_04662 [Smallanthus sonchifolius]|uniref:Uncharacterized protein n=1 Tax=Smallanthus sonchifolius TaxID=185202 RepID=A0ACB9JT72_9ASTR|nr:hypothetical protein L1987_04662 [Smallanthus sonchifolius]
MQANVGYAQTYKMQGNVGEAGKGEEGEGVSDKPREKKDRIYDYDVYNDLGDPDKDPDLALPVLDNKDYPHPRRCKTSQPPTKSDPLSESRSIDVYMPRDEVFSEVKNLTFNVKTVYSVLKAVIPSLETMMIDKNLGFPYFIAIDSLFNEGVNLPRIESDGFLKKKLSMDSEVLVALSLSLVGGLSTSLGALFVILTKAPNLKMLGLLQGFAAGLMLSISFFDLAHNAINSIGFLKGNIWFFGGVIFFAIIANFIPEPSLAPTTDAKNKKKQVDEGGKDIMKKHRRQVLFSGIITAVGISLHNFPEGMAVFLGSLKGLRVGLNLALAIALHNIPEGVAVALPVYFATQSKWQAFKLATVSGLAEPLGVIIVAYLFPSSLDPEILEGLLGSVGGVMAFLTLHEMLPLAFDYAGQKQAVKAVFFGMAFMSASLYFLEISLPSDIGL